VHAQLQVLLRTASFRVARENWVTTRAKADFLRNLLATIKKREREQLPVYQVLMEYSGDCYGDPSDTLTGRAIRMLHDSLGVCVTY